MKKSKVPNVRVESLGKEFIVRVYHNDGYTRPTQLGGYFKTRKSAEEKRTKFINNYMGLEL